MKDLEKKKIIILENGFDLHTKLHSSFSDFFKESEKKLIESFIEYPYMSFNPEDLSFLSLLLYNTLYRETITFYGGCSI